MKGRPKKVEAETYPCGECGRVVNVDTSGRRWSAEFKKWLCGPCFGRLVNTMTEAEIEAALAQRSAS